MVLQLQKVYFKNWKCYLDLNYDFCLDKNHNLDLRKNILVIAGQNGAGKTSFQTGILWCLYGDDVVPRQNLTQCFNRINLKKNPELDLLVRLTFVDDQHTYNIQRGAKIAKRGSSYIPRIENIKLYLDGKEKPDANERIEFLLPRSCREFFFFDGTKIDEYAKLTHNTATRQAIERTLGIPEVKNLRDDSEGVVKKFEAKIREASKTRKQLQEIIAKATALKQEIAAKKGQIKKIKSDLVQYKKFLQDNQQRISQIEELTKKQSEIQVDIRQKETWVQETNNLEPETISSGEKEALAFAFIVGLNLISRPARLLMMDTPFGNLDQEHKKNIIQYLSNIRSQVILLATDSDISDSLLQELQPFISQVHRVSRLDGSEDASCIEVEK